MKTDWLPIGVKVIEAVISRCSSKLSQISQENTCVGVFFQ